MKRILTIAASDSGGGAGIQADIKAITLLGGFAMSAITALTAQNTRHVEAIYPMPVSFIEQQIDAVMQDIGVDAIKTGMLYTAEIVGAVAKKITASAVPAVVVDPVMRSKGGETLLQEQAIETMKRELFPCALIATPNLDEAALLCGFPVDSLAKMREAAEMVRNMGPRAVVIKGGHLADQCIDIFYDGTSFTELPSPRITTVNTHGTGCTYASAIAAHLANGFTPLEAVRKAKEFIQIAIRCAFPLGKGHGPTNPFANIERNAELWECASALRKAVKRLEQKRIGHLIAEVQSNFGYALTNAATAEDVLAFPGRIIRLNDSIATVAEPAPGASRHIAKIILTVLPYDRRFRSAMNICYSAPLIEKCKVYGFRIASFDRTAEPKTVRESEGSSLEWGTAQVLSRAKGIPDIIYDTGGMGKEAMIRVLGTSPMDVAEKVLQIAAEG